MHYTVPISGVPGATVEALLDGSHGGGDTVELDESGLGSIDLRPDAVQYALPFLTTVTFQYLLGDGSVGPSVTTTLWELQISPAE